MSYYVYRFLNSNKEIIYIGKSKNLTHRLYSHFNNQRKEWMDEVKSIEVAKFQDGATMSIYELYYIDLYKPKYNKEGIYRDTNTSIVLQDIKFNVYDFNFKVSEEQNIEVVDKDTIVKTFTLIINKDMDLDVSDSIMSQEVVARLGRTMKNIKTKFKPILTNGEIKISTSYTNIIPLGEVGINPYKNLNKMYISKSVSDDEFDIILYIHPKDKQEVDGVVKFMHNNSIKSNRYIYIPDKTLAKYVMEYFDYNLKVIRIK